MSSSSSVPAPNPVYSQLEPSPFPQQQHSYPHYQSQQHALYLGQQQHQQPQQHPPHQHYTSQGQQEPVHLRHRDSLSAGEIQHQLPQQHATGDTQEVPPTLDKTTHASSAIAERTPHWILDPQAISLSPGTSQYPPQSGPGSTPSSTAPYNAAMRYHHPADMAVPPSMDRYDDGRHGHAWPPGLQVSTTTVATSKSLIQPSSPYEPKKRPRKQSIVEANVPEDEKKRARGRPRLDTKDQTPAERRRTQIRLAQRAYRSRKETAISELETKVQSLKDVNDEISAAVQELCIAAKGRGILDQVPEFHRQIQRLQILTKRSRDASLNDEELTSPPGVDSEDVRRGSMHMSSADPGSAISETKVETTQSVWGNVMVSQDHMVRHGAQHGMPGSHMSSAMEEEPVEYEVLAVPTPSNASFATTAGPYAYDSTSFFNPLASQQWGAYPWSSLPNPNTMAYHESSFSRRLYRFTKEMAARLITMDSPPVDRMLRVFGFSRLFESMEQIRERTLHDLTKTKDEPLCNYNYPFHSLGGAGNHFPGRMLRPNSCANPSGTASVSSASSSSSGSNSSSNSAIGADAKNNRIGPLDPKSRLIRDRLLDIHQHIHMPGLGGNFWDCDEVEYYLAENGISIPSPTDFQVVEIQPGAFPNGDIAAAEARAAQQHQHHTSQSHHSHSARHLGHERNVWPPLSDANSHAALTATSGPTGAASFITAHAITGSFDGGTHSNSFSAAAAAAAAAGLSSMGGSGFGTQAESTSSALSPAGAILAPVTHNQQVGQASGGPGPANGRRATLNVTKFLSGLGSRAVCLGRTPGFRVKDIDQAFWESVTIE